MCVCVGGCRGFGGGGSIPLREAAAADCEIHIDCRSKHTGKQQQSPVFSTALSAGELRLRLVTHRCTDTQVHTLSLCAEKRIKQYLENTATVCVRVRLTEAFNPT